MNYRRMLVVTRTDLRQLLTSKDFLIPLGVLAALFFLILPGLMLLAIGWLGEVGTVSRISATLDVLPEKAQAALRGDTPSARTEYALAVYLFAPLAVIVPLTISTAIGAATMVGERERGTGEFLAHSPAGTDEIYVGKLLASFLPGYAATFLGFGVYSVLVNTVVGPKVGGWFFPTTDWWILMLWFVPPFLIFAMTLVLRLSARVKSTIAAQQASGLVTLPMIVLAYTQSTGTLFGASRTSTLLIGGIAWLAAMLSLVAGMRAVKRTRLLGVAI